MSTTSLAIADARTRPIQWFIVRWFSLVHIAGFLGILYIVFVHCSAATIWLAATLFLLCHFSITAGVHRLYSHRTFEATRRYQIMVLAFFSATFQYSALEWCYMHRAHHANSDAEGDPHSAVRHGLRWSHMAWVLRTPTKFYHSTGMKDLLANPLLRFQNRHHYLIAFTVGLFLPWAIAAIGWGDYLGGLLVAGFTRLVVQYHTTWSINSIVHKWGMYRHSKVDAIPYTMIERVVLFIVYDAILAILTVEESCDHGGHHDAPDDWRIARSPWALAPGRWWISFWYLCGWISNRREVSPEEFEKRGRSRLAVGGAPV